MLATSDARRKELIMGALVNLYRELGDRIVLTGSLTEIIEAEWSEKPHVPSRSFKHFEQELLAGIRGNGAETMLDEEGRRFAEWRQTRRAHYAAATEEFATKYTSDERFGQAIALAIANARPPAIYETCDDVAAQLIEEYTKRDEQDGLRLAKASPERYLSTWTFASLFRIAQFAATIPVQERAKGSFGGYAKLLKSDKNDMTDATIAALGARCGFLITQDSDLRERITFLHERGVC
jgi:predicted nucleic acid-binding protein